MEPFDLQAAPENLLPLVFNPAGIYPFSLPKYLRGTSEIPISEFYKINPSVVKIVKDTPGCDTLLRAIGIRLWISSIAGTVGVAGWILCYSFGDFLGRRIVPQVLICSLVLTVVSQVVF